MRLPELSVPLDEAALLISGRANPGLDVAAQLRRLDDLSSRVDPADVPSLCRLLFDQLGLRGDREHYHDPLNSYIDQVLDRRRGIPISLSVLMIEIGRRCGVHLDPVGMPGHFLVRDPSAPGQLIDAFDRGRRLPHAECERLWHAVTGRRAPLTPDLLATAGTWSILARMLANLDRSFEQRGEQTGLAWVSDLRVSVPNASLPDRTQLAGRLAALGRLGPAASVLEAAAAAATDREMRDRLLSQALTLRAQLN
jgi:regulator of sirC expression with transglutaminase-like and TPR domain